MAAALDVKVAPRFSHQAGLACSGAWRRHEAGHAGSKGVPGRTRRALATQLAANPSPRQEHSAVPSRSCCQDGMRYICTVPFLLSGWDAVHLYRAVPAVRMGRTICRRGARV
eukprot:366275-Chlamydomonas_euryale.AAC.3